MIFCTVGTQLPFERMLREVDLLAGEVESEEFFAQIGDSSYEPVNMKWVRSMDEITYYECLSKAKVILGHAGMGTIISSVDYDVPLVMFPRYFSKQEHRNDHQLSTARKFSRLSGIFVVYDNDDLVSVFAEAFSFSGKRGIEESGADELSSAIKTVIYKELL